MFGSFEYVIFTSFVLSKIVAASAFNVAEYVITISSPMLSFSAANFVALNVIVYVVVPLAFVTLVFVKSV